MMSTPESGDAGLGGPPPDADLQFRVFLASQGYESFRLFPEPGVWTAVHRLAYHWALLFGIIGDRTGYNDRWCYQTREAVHAALWDWDPSDGGEPEGWHRNPPTGRRRPEGDATREYIAW